MTAMPSATTRFPYIKMLMVFALLVTVVSAESTEAVRSSPAFNTSTLTSNSTSAKPYLRSDAVMATSDDASSLSERAFITLGAQLLASSKSALANQIRQLLEQLAKTPAGDAMIKGYLFRWALEGRTSTEVFELLGLDKSGENFLNNLLASTWSRYVTSRGFNDPTAVMLKTVAETMGDKSLILRAVARAHGQDNELVTRLREAEFERLQAEHKTLEGVEKELFKPTRHYDDQDLAKFLVGVKDVDSTKPLMTRLEQEWALKRKTSTEVFKLLGLHESGENFLNNPLLSLWSRYVTSSGSNDPTAVMIKTVTETIDKSLLLKAVIQARDQDSELVIKLRNAAFERLEAELLKPTRHYDEEDLAKFLVAVKDVDSTKLLVTRLEQELAHKGKTSTEVFKLLELDKSGENFLNNPLLSVWSRYVTSRGFDDPTAVMIETVIEAIKDKSLLLRAVIQARDQDSELVIRLGNKAFERLLAEETPEKVEKELSKFTDEAGKKALYRFQKFYGKRKAEPISKGDASIKNNGIHIN